MEAKPAARIVIGVVFIINAERLALGIYPVSAGFLPAI